MPLLPDPLIDPKPSGAAERRAEEDRRSGDRRRLVLVPPLERRTRASRRQNRDRRSDPEQRGSASAEEHIRGALELLMTVVDTRSLDDELRRNLDTAMLRLHFALERLRGDTP